MISHCAKFSLLLFILIGLCTIFCECQNFDTTPTTDDDASWTPEVIRGGKAPTGHHPTPTSGHRPANRYPTSRSTYPSARPTRTTFRPPSSPYPSIIPTIPSPKPTRTRRTTPKPTKPSFHFPKSQYAALFGGLAGTTLGLYLGEEISKIDWEADMPAYTVHHYWHQKGYPLSNNPIVEANAIVGCPENVSFCVPKSMMMCLESGEIYCVTSEFQTHPCTNSTVGACLTTTLRVKCSSRWGFDCILTGYKDVEESIPCLEYSRVKYQGTTNRYNEDFYFPSNYTISTPVWNDCKRCNNTQLTPKEIDVTCIKLNVGESVKTFCSGIDLTNLALVTMNSTLNSTNSRKLSCLPQNAVGNIGDIFTAQSKSALTRCEFEDGSNAISMKCGNIANLYSSNVSIPFDANSAVLRCSIENETDSNQTCRCSSTVDPVQSAVYTIRYCVAISAYPMRLYNNRDYLFHLNKYPELKQENDRVTNNMLTLLGRYILF